jgi:GNAT superfamily N-acetyltransferase
MSSTPNSVRLARTSDVDDIARIQVAAWRTAYADLLPAEVLDSLDADEIAWEWGRALLQPGMHRLLVAMGADGTAVGAAAVGPSPDPDAAGAGEISLLIVDPVHWREGHGSRLLQASVDHLVGAGHREALTWVPVDDEPRRAFLQSAGWGPDRAYRDREVADGVMREVRLVTIIADDEGSGGAETAPISPPSP